MKFEQYRDKLREQLDKKLTQPNELHHRFARQGVTNEVFKEQVIVELFNHVSSEKSDTIKPNNVTRTGELAQKILGSRGSREDPLSYCNVLATFVYARCNSSILEKFGDVLLDDRRIPSDSELPVEKKAWKDCGIDEQGVFWEYQFIFCPVILRIPDENVFAPACPRPFVSKPKFLDSGGYGKVWEVEIEVGHLFDTKRRMHNVEVNKADFQTPESI